MSVTVEDVSEKIEALDLSTFKFANKIVLFIFLHLSYIKLFFFIQSWCALHL
jgi:hypothetical protein